MQIDPTALRYRSQTAALIWCQPMSYKPNVLRVINGRSSLPKISQWMSTPHLSLPISCNTFFIFLLGCLQLNLEHYKAFSFLTQMKWSLFTRLGNDKCEVSIRDQRKRGPSIPSVTKIFLGFCSIVSVNELNNGLVTYLTYVCPCFDIFWYFLVRNERFYVRYRCFQKMVLYCTSEDICKCTDCMCSIYSITLRLLFKSDYSYEFQIKEKYCFIFSHCGFLANNFYISTFWFFQRIFLAIVIFWSTVCDIYLDTLRNEKI